MGPCDSHHVQVIINPFFYFHLCIRKTVGVKNSPPRQRRKMLVSAAEQEESAPISLWWTLYGRSCGVGQEAATFPHSPATTSLSGPHRPPAG